MAGGSSSILVWRYNFTRSICSAWDLFHVTGKF